MADKNLHDCESRTSTGSGIGRTMRDYLRSLHAVASRTGATGVAAAFILAAAAALLVQAGHEVDSQSEHERTTRCRAAADRLAGEVATRLTSKRDLATQLSRFLSGHRTSDAAGLRHLLSSGLIPDAHHLYGVGVIHVSSVGSADAIPQQTAEHDSGVLLFASDTKAGSADSTFEKLLSYSEVLAACRTALVLRNAEATGKLDASLTGLPFDAIALCSPMPSGQDVNSAPTARSCLVMILDAADLLGQVVPPRHVSGSVTLLRRQEGGSWETVASSVSEVPASAVEHGSIATRDRFITLGATSWQVIATARPAGLHPITLLGDTLHDTALIMSGLAVLALVVSNCFATRSTTCKVVEGDAEHLQHLAILADRTPSAVIVTDMRQRIVWVNNAFTSLTGYRSDDAIGRTPGSLLDAGFSDPVAKNIMRQAVARFEGCRVELKNRGKHGQRFTVECEILPIADQDGTRCGFMAIETDVSERRLVEDSLREREAELRAIISATPGALFRFRLGPARDIQFMSAGAYNVFGRPSEAFFGSMRQPYEDLIHVEDRDRVARVVSDAAIKHTPWEVLYRIHHGSGEIRWVYEQGTTFPTAGDRANGIQLCGVLVDVTPQKRVEEELSNTNAELATARVAAEAANRAKSAFLANMSHEIRTPLASILGFVDLLREEAGEYSADAKRREALSAIASAGHHLLTIINDILDLSKIEAERMTIDPVIVDLHQFLQETMALMQPRAEYQSLELSVRLDTPLPRLVRVDPTRLRQILLNLLGNAIKFTAAGRVDLVVSVGRIDNTPMLVFDVSDTGPGMTSDQAGQLFRPFMQLPTQKRQGGTGLGLAICKRLAGLMDGDVTLHRTSVGEGSTFRVVIPLVESVSSEALTELCTTATPHRDTIPRSGLRVLLAEDGLDNQRIISHYLRRGGFEVDIVENGKLALEALNAANASGRTYDLILSDLQMPEMDGLTLARTLRAEGHDIPLIALTAHALAEERENSLNAGFDAFATKPVNREELLALCIRWSDRKDARPEEQTRDAKPTSHVTDQPFG